MSVAQLRARPSDLFITEQLDQRSATQADYLQEKRALQDLAARMLDAPQEVLPGLVDLAMKITGGVSAGISLLEEDPPPGVFRWRYLRGVLAEFEDATTPRNDSPCGVTLDEGRPVLSCHPERYYDWIFDAGIIVPEVLLVPLHFDGAVPLGTLWIVAEAEGHFNADHARAASDLAHFAGIAVRMLATQQQLKAALEQHELLVKEMNHRTKNLFTIAQSLVQLTAKTSATKEETANVLVGRLSALARAHSLVRRSFSSGSEQHCRDLGALLRTVLEPHESRSTQNSRFSLKGPAVDLGEQSLNGLALVFHELATNAVKYGALASDGGRVDITWFERPDASVVITWAESGGRAIDHEPEMNGFGSKLLRDTITRQFGGTLDKSWAHSGLTARIAIPLANLSR
jgi:two-component sensor histidine kinase